MSATCVGELSELWIGELQSVQVGRERVLLVRHAGGVCAYDDRCAHLGVALSEGSLEGDRLTCRAHGYCFDVRDGRGLNPQGVQLVAWRVEVRDGRLWLTSPRDNETLP